MKKIFNKIVLWITVFVVSLFAFGCENKENSGTSDLSCKHTFSSDSYDCQDRICSKCGVKISASKNHEYNIVKETVEPDCENDGYTVYSCFCGAVENRDYVSSVGHNYEKYVSSHEATCKGPAYNVYECEKCGKTNNVYTSAPLSHSFNENMTETVVATCTLGGYSKKYCTVCKEYIYTEYSEKIGHTPDLSKDKITAPTCIESGYTRRYCSVCKKYYKDLIVDATGHNWKQTGHFEATCEHNEYTVLNCTVCGETIREFGTEVKKEHNYDQNGICTMCNKSVLQVMPLTSYDPITNKTVFVEKSTDYGYIIYHGKSYVNVVIDKDTILRLVDNGCEEITMRFGNPDDNYRSFSWNIASTPTDVHSSNSRIAYGFEETSKFVIKILNSDGSLNNGVITNEGLNVRIYHNNYTGYEIQNCFALKIEYGIKFDESKKSMWLKESTNATVEYVENSGWKVSAINEDFYNFLINKDLISKKIADGYTKMKIKYGKAFDGETFDGVETDCEIWMLAHKSLDGSDDWYYQRNVLTNNNPYISGYSKNEDGTYTCTVDFSNEDYIFGNYDLRVRVAYNSVLAKSVGCCYIYSIEFEK